ncbi:THUMP domain-containing protein 3-like isoform X2 [Selaginella moellendorffii]|uniref:THUMP domain-containing protein 3-like isoform X2 n=1 Tax=Selaginella moellendorffii TaxID=88036 RepID=UPI000D1C6F56|nr:THUMP domain-containing protein 3-like isoform X2 [Selaginella moellendorffii]|eukprot:XP_024523378.1 THUMP domain-containing protein 3-like isoform X2 [Selaginella moellendorffii]
MELYYASCAAGIERVLVSEVERLPGTRIEEATVSFYGGILFQTESSPEDVFKLRAADNVYAYLGHFKDVPVDKDGALSYLKSLASKISWEPALLLFRKWQAMQDRVLQSPLTFRVTCERKCLKMKKHPFSSVDVAAALGESVYNLHNWPADMRCYNVEVFAWLRDSELLVAIGLLYGKPTEQVVDGRKAPRPSRSDSQLYSKRLYRKALVPTSLRPSVAYALVQLGHIKCGDVVLDPMCGCGTIPLEAADCFRGQLLCLGGDISPCAVAAAGENARGSDACDILQWNATFMPVRSGCVDWVICDMPFGVRCGSTQARDWLCPKVTLEIARVLRQETGVAVLMSQGKAMKQEMENTTYLKLLQQYEADMEGILVEIYIAQRTSQPIQSLEKVSQKAPCKLKEIKLLCSWPFRFEGGFYIYKLSFD